MKHLHKVVSRESRKIEIRSDVVSNTEIIELGKLLLIRGGWG